METELLIVCAIVGIVGLIMLIYKLSLNPRKFKFPKFDRAKRRLAKKEKIILRDLVEDMRENPGHWVRNGYCPVTFKGPMIVNDYSSIGLQFGQHGETSEIVLIHFNLVNENKFDQNDENSIATRIEGAHARKFINTITKIMDERGKELDYFRSRIIERL